MMTTDTWANIQENHQSCPEEIIKPSFLLILDSWQGLVAVLGSMIQEGGKQ